MNSSPHTDNLRRGALLSRLAGLLFDTIARNWQIALGLEVAAGVIGAVLAIWGPSGRIGLAGTVIGFVCLSVAYILRLRVEIDYDTAETIRRQSVFTEALGWHVSDAQIFQWRRNVGKRIRDQAEHDPRADDYYATQKPPGAQRLVAMTEESAFFTNYQYCLLRKWILRMLTVVGTFAFIALMLPLTLSDSNEEILGRLLYALLPIVFALDLIGWWMRLGRTTDNLDHILRSLEQLRTSGVEDVDQVLRVIAEYNSQVANGIPLPCWLFKRWHDEIRSEWERYLLQHGGVS